MPTRSADYINVNGVTNLLGAREETILYVDDQPSHRLLFEHTFRGDWVVLTASSAEEGFKIIEEHQVFLVVADHNMPEVTGIDFLARVKEACPKAVRAILSAYSDEALREEARQKAGISAYLEKPWDREKIRSFIEESYSRFVGILTDPVPQRSFPSLEEIPQEKQGAIHQLAGLASHLEEKVDDRGARRIILSYSEPRLRKYVARVHRAVPTSWIEALESAVKANTEGLEEALQRYFQRISN